MYSNELPLDATAETFSGDRSERFNLAITRLLLRPESSEEEIELQAVERRRNIFAFASALQTLQLVLCGTIAAQELFRGMNPMHRKPR
jgi:hypothetical protein